MSKVDWAHLLQQDRCKALGVPWSEEELKAKEAGVPASYVRAGIMTMKRYQKQVEKEEVEGKELATMTLSELQEEAIVAGAKYAGITPRETLIELIKQARLINDAGLDTSEDEEEEEEEEEEVDEDPSDVADTADEDVDEEDEEEEEEVVEKSKKKKKAKTKKKNKRKRNR